MMPSAATIEPAGRHNNIPVVFSFDEDFAPHFCVALQSLLDTSSADFNYDLVILASRLSTSTTRLLRAQTGGRSNISLRFYDPSGLFQEYNFGEWVSFPDARFSEAAYYRLFIPQIFARYDKVIYLDSDILIRRNLSELFNHDLGNNLLGAVKRNTTRYMRERRPNYFRNTLGFKDVSLYVNSGVLLFNIALMNRENTLSRLMAIAKRDDLRDCDQAVLNLACRDRILYLDPRWNAQWSVVFNPTLTDLSAEELDAIMHEAYIIHYTVQKVTQSTVRSGSYLGILWWQCARKTPYYEQLLFEDAARRAAESHEDRVEDKIRRLREGKPLPVRVWLLIESFFVRKLTNAQAFEHYLRSRDTFFTRLKNPLWRQYYAFASIFFKA